MFINKSADGANNICGAAVARLRKAGFEGTLTVELEKNDKYDHMSNEEYIKTAYERIMKISEM